MLHCWACRAVLSQKQAQRDGFLCGRSAEAGGPYLLYHCPSCHKENRIENLPDGNFYSSPAKEVGIIDWLFGRFEPLAPEDFLKLQNWQHKYGEERQAVFESLGDHRYSGSLWRRLLNFWISRKTTATQPDQAQEQQKSAPGTPKKPTVLPHPYRILGIPLDADAAQIRERFRKLVKTHHPDKILDASPEDVDEASRRLQELLDAYETLENEGRI
ncbi:MAG: DnaJ domain-containing protein [Planctomycetota bacterium]